MSIARKLSEQTKAFHLFFAESSLSFCISLYNLFYKETAATVINGTYIDIDEEYDCLVVAGNCKEFSSILIVFNFYLFLSIF